MLERIPSCVNQRIPARLNWATSVVAANAPRSILEIGYGRGVAIVRLAALLPSARIVGVDRSSVAFQAASLRNAELIRASRCSIQQAGMMGSDIEEQFDAIVAVNVNVFWTTCASEELTWIRERLAARGLLYLFYETPSDAQRRRIEADLTKHLSGSGLHLIQVLEARLGPNAGLGVIASSPGTHS